MSPEIAKTSSAALVEVGNAADSDILRKEEKKRKERREKEKKPRDKFFHLDKMAKVGITKGSHVHYVRPMLQ